MSSSGNLSPQRTRLAEALKLLREATGVSGREMAADLAWSQAKISRSERGRNVPPIADLRKWLDYCGASGEYAGEVLGLAEQVATEVVTNRELNRVGHAPQQWQRIAHDAEADAVMVYQPEVIPGLLQTPEYMRRLLLSIGSATPETVADSIAARVQRQSFVYDESKTVEFVITETALAWQPGPANVSREQLSRLRTLAEYPNVHIGIVPRQQQKHAPTCNSFVLTRWPDGAKDVVTESLTAEVTITDADDIATYETMFTTQSRFAAYGDEGLSVISRVADELD